MKEAEVYAAQINLSDQLDTNLSVAAAGECELLSAGAHVHMKLNQIGLMAGIADACARQDLAEDSRDEDNGAAAGEYEILVFPSFILKCLFSSGTLLIFAGIRVTVAAAAESTTATGAALPAASAIPVASPAVHLLSALPHQRPALHQWPAQRHPWPAQRHPWPWPSQRLLAETVWG